MSQLRKIFFAVGDLCRWPCAASDCYMKSVKRRPSTKCERWACVPGTPRTTTHTSTLPTEPSTVGSTASLASVVASTPEPPITSTGSICLKPCDSSDGEGSGQDAERGTNMTRKDGSDYSTIVIIFSTMLVLLLIVLVMITLGLIRQRQYAEIYWEARAENLRHLDPASSTPADPTGGVIIEYTPLNEL
jgi:hypothetical protein